MKGNEDGSTSDSSTSNQQPEPIEDESSKSPIPALHTKPQPDKQQPEGKIMQCC